MPNLSLPVWQLHAEIIRILTSGNQLVLVAATGSGKTTQVPQMLLDAGLAGTKQIVVLAVFHASRDPAVWHARA